MQSCSKHESECIDNASIESYPTKVITNISDDEVDMVSSNNVDHKALLDDEAGFNEIVASSTTYRKKTNKKATSNKLSKILKTCKDSVEGSIGKTTRDYIR